MHSCMRAGREGGGWLRRKYGVWRRWVGVKKGYGGRVKWGMRGRHRVMRGAEATVYFAPFQGISGSTCMGNAGRA